MKIKTITCHDVYNYGASLQAFSLQKFLELNGHDVEIIDYKPTYIAIHYNFSWFVHPYSPVKRITEKSIIIKFLYCLKRYLWSLPKLSRKYAFDAFTKQYLKTTKLYNNYQNLKSDLPEADIYIVGSDQVWNSMTMLNGKDPAFFLQFAPKNKKRIAYAASFGANKINQESKKIIKDWIGSLDAISVRESSGLKIISELGLNGTHVCDPVFLLDANDWSFYLDLKNLNTKYILIYNLTSRNEQLISDAVYLSKKLGIPLYSVSPIKIKEAKKNYVGAGPKDFVNLIFNAEFVFTNSFHATAFSIISHRQFFTYNYHSKENSSRMYSVLEEFGLLDRLNIIDIKYSYDKKINYAEKDILRKKSSSTGKKWLLNNISNLKTI